MANYDMSEIHGDHSIRTEAPKTYTAQELLQKHDDARAFAIAVSAGIALTILAGTMIAPKAPEAARTISLKQPDTAAPR